LSPLTGRALKQNVEDYVSKDTDEYALIEELKARHKLPRVYRFDIGKNTDGYSDLIEGVLEMADLAGLCRENLVEYPDNHYRLLLERMSASFGLDPSCFAISAGLECMIDHISRSFLHPDAHFLLPIPNFSVFESFSLRTGASPLYLQLDKDQGFQWTEQTVEKMLALITEKQPALVWISNPVNPTGQDLPVSWIRAVVEQALSTNTAVVVDEAYGEYTDPDYGREGAFRLIPATPTSWS
jgi:histidinol-phosphate aminotransferase